MTAAERAVLAALVAVYQRDGYASCGTVATEVGRSKSTTHGHLKRLHKAGLADYGVNGGLAPSPDLVVVDGEIHQAAPVERAATLPDPFQAVRR